MNPSELARISAALQKQVARDLEPIWQVSATVDSFPTLEDVPAGYWPIILTFRALGAESGIHVDRNGQPFALVELTTSWSLTASHVCLELVTDPFGSRTFPGASPRPDQGDVEFLGAICDPCEHFEFGYLINDVLVSDFCTPAYWDPSPNVKERRSFTGAIQFAYQVLPGGHLSWYDPATNSWWLRRFSGGVLTDTDVGSADAERGSVREFMGRHSPHLLGTKMTAEAYEARVGVRRQRALRASQSRAFWLRAAFGGTHAGEPLELAGEERPAFGAMPADRNVAVFEQPQPTRGSIIDAAPDMQIAAVHSAIGGEHVTAAPDEITQNVAIEAIEAEVAAALNRAQGEVRGTVQRTLAVPVAPPVAAEPPAAAPAPAPEPPAQSVLAQPVARTLSRSVPPPLPRSRPAPIASPQRAPLDEVVSPGASSPSVSFPPSVSVPPSEVSVVAKAPAGKPVDPPRPKSANRSLYMGSVAVAAAAVAIFAMSRGAHDEKPAGTVGGASIIDVRPATAPEPRNPSEPVAPVIQAPQPITQPVTMQPIPAPVAPPGMAPQPVVVAPLGPPAPTTSTGTTKNGLPIAHPLTVVPHTNPMVQSRAAALAARLLAGAPASASAAAPAAAPPGVDPSTQARPPAPIDSLINDRR